MARYSIDDEQWINVEFAGYSRVVISRDGEVTLHRDGTSETIKIPKEIFEKLFAPPKFSVEATGKIHFTYPPKEKKATPHSCAFTDPANQGKPMLYYCPVCCGGATM